MIIPDRFTISGMKTLMFRKETDQYITYNPSSLEYYKLNDSAIEILFYISMKVHVDKITEIISKEYNVDEKMVKEDIYSFIESFPCKDLILDNLLEVGIVL